MPEAFVFPETTEVTSAAAVAGVAPASTGPAAEAVGGPAFAQWLAQGQAEPEPEPEEKGTEAPAGEGAWAGGMPLTFWQFNGAGLDEALKALLDANGSAPQETPSSPEPAPAVQAGEAAVLADATLGSLAASAANSTQPREAASQGLQVEASFKTEPGAPSGAEPAVSSAPAAPAVEATASGGKLKLDFSAFDAAFPEGWQVLLENAGETAVQPETLPSTLAADGAGKGMKSVLGPQAPATSARAASSPQAPATGNSDQLALGYAETNPSPVLQVLPVPNASFHANHDGNQEPAASGEKNQETAAPRVEVKAETLVARTWFASETLPRATAAAAASATPASLLARLSDLQQQMVVTDFAQSALPAFKGKGETLTVDLNPPELGRVQLRVETSGTGVQAVLTVQDRSLGEFFQGQMDPLRKTLEEAGIRLSGLSVEIRQQFNQEAQERQSLAQDKPSRGLGMDQSVSVESRKKTQAWGARGLSRVDMMV